MLVQSFSAFYMGGRDLTSGPHACRQSVSYAILDPTTLTISLNCHISSGRKFHCEDAFGMEPRDMRTSVVHLK